MRRSRWQTGGWGLAAASAVVGLALGGVAHGQNTIGGDAFAPGEADFVQNGTQAGRGPGFQFSDEFYTANGINAAEIRAQETFSPNGGLAPSRFHAFYRGDDAGDAFVAPGTAPDSRFLDNTRILIHNMGTNAAGEMLFYPDPPAFFFESAFLNEETKDLTNRSFVYIFPRSVQYNSTVAGCVGQPTSFDYLDPGPCNRRQDNIFDTGNGYLTSNPLQLWRIVFVTWDGQDIGSPQCQARMAEMAARNGLDTDGTPNFRTVHEVLEIASSDLIAGQGTNEVVLAGGLPGASGLPNPDPRSDIPGVEPEAGGQVCVTVRTRRQVDGLGNPASPQNPLDGAPFVV